MDKYNLISQFTGHVITYPSWDKGYSWLQLCLTEANMPEATVSYILPHHSWNQRN